MQPVVAIVSMPFWWDGYAKDFRSLYRAVLFDYQDSVATYSRNSQIKRRMEILFEELMKDADGLIAHTEAGFSLLASKRSSAGIILVRNGCDETLPMRRIPRRGRTDESRPIIGTVGRITENIDVSLLLELADRFPTATIENVGTVSNYRKALKSKRNIRLSPPESEEKLLEKIANFDIGILPYRSDIEGSPMRVYDLLSMHLQVVSTFFPDVTYFENVVHVARKREEFIPTVDSLINGRRMQIQAEAMEQFLKENRWEGRVAALVAFCEKLLSRTQ